ncbi:Mannitol operon repressor [Vibrio stylophorae]|uniref:Mannitol operon repressor n=1 Tax=Vibrio stylophorae TaxID=659351 RepID=A0ABM8ZR55_9VIBR|nr:MltR family transcriptional regulator [Vibrio stylophorae]CAH0532748.1 Mannitol operon repressor [Vibrio stylophorae]
MTDMPQESEILERLNGAPTVRGFFIVAVDIFHLAVDGLMQRIFQKDNFAVQSVVGPLLQASGPLGDLSVRLKLLFGLGVIANDVYHDIETMVKLKHQLNNDGHDYDFTTAQLIEPILKMHLVKRMGMMPDTFAPFDESDLALCQLQQQRQQRVVQSSLSLVIVEICNALNQDSPFR